MRLDTTEVRVAVERWVDHRYGHCTLASGHYDMTEADDRKQLVDDITKDVVGVCGLIGEVGNDGLVDDAG